jgi:hypothetical protein
LISKNISELKWMLSLEEVIFDNVAYGLQHVGGVPEDVVQQEVCLKGLVLVSIVETIALIVHEIL